MNKFHSFSVGDVSMVEHVNTYNDEAVEHLVNQLIKLQQEYDRNQGTYATGESQINVAIKTINVALEKALDIEGGE